MPVPVPPYSAGKREREHVGVAHQLDRIPGELASVINFGRARRNPLPRQLAHRLDQELMLSVHTSISSSGAVVRVS